MTGNAVGWFEIYVEDMIRARKFYQAVFECQLKSLGMPEIEMWAFPMQNEAPGAAGALVRAEGFPSGANSTLVYFTCDDCAVEAKRAEGNGGTIAKEKFSIGPYGWVSLVTDTEGNMIGLHSMQ